MFFTTISASSLTNLSCSCGVSLSAKFLGTWVMDGVKYMSVLQKLDQQLGLHAIKLGNNLVIFD